MLYLKYIDNNFEKTSDKIYGDFIYQYMNKGYIVHDTDSNTDNYYNAEHFFELASSGIVFGSVVVLGVCYCVVYDDISLKLYNLFEFNREIGFVWQHDWLFSVWWYNDFIVSIKYLCDRIIEYKQDSVVISLSSNIMNHKYEFKIKNMKKFKVLLAKYKTMG